jgi:hypothetical protein
MTLFAESPEINASTTVLSEPARQRQDLDGQQRHHASSPAGEFCQRCCGLLVPSYTAALEPDCTGKPATLWRCVNCGDCVDIDILANRWKSLKSARVRARPTRRPQRTGQSRGIRTGMFR